MWKIRIDHGKKEHIVKQNRSGEPTRTTFCGKECKPENRQSGARKTRCLSGLECATCVKEYNQWWAFGIQAGLPGFTPQN
jgi:hypothetical protein